MFRNHCVHVSTFSLGENVFAFIFDFFLKLLSFSTFIIYDSFLTETTFDLTLFECYRHESADYHHVICHHRGNCALTVLLRDVLPGQLLRRGEAVHQFLPGDGWRGWGQGGRWCGGVTEVVLLEEEVEVG